MNHYIKFMKGKIILLVLLVVFASSKVSLFGIGHNFVPKDEMEYVNYLKIILGRHDESNTLSNELTTLLTQNRASIANAVNKVMLVLMPESESNNQQSSGTPNKIQLQGKFLQVLVSSTPQLFTIVKQLTGQEQLLQNTVESKKQGNMVKHVIQASKQQIKRIANIIGTENQQIKAINPQPSRRLSEKQAISGVAQGSYLIKFFFSLLFIIVIIGTVGIIANNDGKKDTLLYAKFIADTGAR